MAEEDFNVGNGQAHAGSIAHGHFSRIKGVAALYFAGDAICTATSALAFKTGDSIADFVVGTIAAGGTLLSTLMLLKIGGYSAEQLFTSNAVMEKELREQGGGNQR